MKKSLGIVRQGDQSVFQKIKAKCEAKDKDKNSTYDTCANTKSSRTFRGKKTNNSSAHAYSETSLSSQVLCDLSYKDASILKTNTSKGTTHPEKATSLVNIQILSTRGSKVPIHDTEKIFEDKPREPHELEEAQFSLSNEIDQALEYLNKNKNLPGVLAEQDKKVQDLKAKLQQVYQEIEQLKLWQKRKSIPVMIQNLYLPDQRASARGDWDKDQMTKLKNLSPSFPLGALEKGNRYKMYEENSAKTLISSFVKNKSSSKISRESIKPLYIGNMKKKVDKPVQSGRNMWSIEEESKLKIAQSNRDYLPAPTITSNKTSKILKERLHAGSSNIPEQRKIESSYLGNLIDRHIAKMGNNKEPERDIAGDYNSLFEKYVALIQQYKSEVKDLTMKNLDLQKIKEQNEKAKTD